VPPTAPADRSRSISSCAKPQSSTVASVASIRGLVDLVERGARVEEVDAPFDQRAHDPERDEHAAAAEVADQIQRRSEALIAAPDRSQRP